MSQPTHTPGKLSRFFFLDGTFAALLLIFFLAIGSIGYSMLIKEDLPDLAIGQATVTTEWPGADPETIEQQITNKIEKKLRSLKGLKKLSSASFSGFSMVSVEFYSNIEVASAMNRLRAKVNEAEADLPKEATKPKINEVSVNDAPILTASLKGDVDIAVLSKQAKSLKERLEKVPGVNKVTLAGNREEAILVRLLTSRMAAVGVSATQVRDALQGANLDMPWGDFEGDELGASFRLYGRFRSVEQMRTLPIVRTDAGRVIRLAEVADIRQDLEREKSRASLSWQGDDYSPSVDISITKRPGSDTLKTIDAIKAELSRSASAYDWPSALQYQVISDQSIQIWDSLSNVFNNGWQAMIAVFIILLVALTWREAIVAGLAIPITFAGALGIIWLLGYTLNQIVIIGLVLALGLLVDVFILMMEGMHENIFNKGKTFPQAALATIKSYSMPALAGQLTTIFAMVPLLAISGTTGKFIRSMPVTAISALVVSYIVALFIAVPLSRLLLGRLKADESKQTLMDRLTAKGMQKLRNLLERVFLRNRVTVILWPLVALGLFVLGTTAMSTLPVEMMPKSDGRNLGVTMELPPDTSLDTAQFCADSMGDVLRQQPYFESVTKLVGKKSGFALKSIDDQLAPTEGTYFVGFSAVFTLRDQREMMAYEYIPELRTALAPSLDDCPGGKLLLSPETGGASSSAPVQVRIIGDDMDTLREITGEVTQVLQSIQGATDINDNLGPSKMDIKTLPRREALNFYQVGMQDLANQVRILMNDDEVGKFSLGGVEDDLKIRLGGAWPSRHGEMGGPTQVREIYLLEVITQQGRSIPITSLADIQVAEASLSILHQDGERAVTVSAQTDNRTAAEIIADLTPKIDALQAQWPQGYRYQFAGEAEDTAETFGSAGTMLGVALFLVFALLVIQFGNFTQPFIIMSAIPLGLIGTFFGNYLFNMPFSFMTMIGLIALIGIVVNNSIVMIDAMNGYLKQGDSIHDAAAKGASDRLRPIITTSITTIVGLTPLALSQPMWQPLCLAVICGLVVSTFMALLIVPCLFALFTSEEKAKAMATVTI